MLDTGYIQHGESGVPMRTEVVQVRHEYLDNYSVWYEGKWRKLHVQVGRTCITVLGVKLTVKVEGV